MRNPEGFLARRLRAREMELGLAMRAHYERGERPPTSLATEHRRVWVARSHAIAEDYTARRTEEREA